MERYPRNQKKTQKVIIILDKFWNFLRKDRDKLLQVRTQHDKTRLNNLTPKLRNKTKQLKNETICEVLRNPVLKIRYDKIPRPENDNYANTSDQEWGIELGQKWSEKVKIFA